MQKYFLIAVGGALGSMARYWVGSMVASRMGTKFPYGTFVINITACVIFSPRRVSASALSLERIIAEISGGENR